MTLDIAVYDPQLGEFGKFVRELQNLPEVRIETSTDNLKKIIETDYDEALIIAEQQPEHPHIQTGNIQDLYQHLKDALDDYNNVMNPKYTGKIREDELIDDGIQRFYDKRMKNHARSIGINIDALIIHDGYPSDMFRNYKELERLVMESDSDYALISFRRLIGVARTAVPVDFTQSHHEIVEHGIGSNSNPQDASR